nr:hypothetical protein [Wolbachia endosymbiont (group B) of Endotricha flammealis]
MTHFFERSPRFAKDLVKEGVAIDIIVRASGLTADELGECEN